MKTNNWRGEFENRFISFYSHKKLEPHPISHEEIISFIQSLLYKQREEIILAISDSYINSIHTSNNEGARLWRNELINKLINKTK